MCIYIYTYIYIYIHMFNHFWKNLVTPPWHQRNYEYGESSPNYSARWIWLGFLWVYQATKVNKKNRMYIATRDHYVTFVDITRITLVYVIYIGILNWWMPDVSDRMGVINFIKHVMRISLGTTLDPSQVGFWVPHAHHPWPCPARYPHFRMVCCIHS